MLAEPGGPSPAGPLDLRLRALAEATDAALWCAENWKFHARASGDAAARALVLSAAQRGIDRGEQLHALLGGEAQRLGPSLVAALVRDGARRMMRRHPMLMVALTIDHEHVRVTEPARLALVACLTGALSNSARHGRSQVVTGHLAVDDPMQPTAITLTLRDAAETDSGPGHPLTADGIGLDAPASAAAASLGPAMAEGRGLRFVRTLVGAAGGTLRIQPEVGRDAGDRGVVVELTLPALPAGPTGLGGFEAATPESITTQLRRRADAALACVGTHGLATPLLEARWVLPSAEADALSAALRQLAACAEAVRALRVAEPV